MGKEASVAEEPLSGGEHTTLSPNPSSFVS